MAPRNPEAPRAAHPLRRRVNALSGGGGACARGAWRAVAPAPPTGCPALSWFCAAGSRPWPWRVRRSPAPPRLGPPPPRPQQPLPPPPLPSSALFLRLLRRRRTRRVLASDARGRGESGGGISRGCRRRCFPFSPAVSAESAECVLRARNTHLLLKKSKKNLKNPLKKPKKNLQKIRVSPAGDFIFFSSSFIK